MRVIILHQLVVFNDDLVKDAVLLKEVLQSSIEEVDFRLKHIQNMECWESEALDGRLDGCNIVIGLFDLYSHTVMTNEEFINIWKEKYNETVIVSRKAEGDNLYVRWYNKANKQGLQNYRFADKISKFYNKVSWYR